MIKISTKIIKQAVYKLCFEANTRIQNDIYSKILSAYQNEKSPETKNILASVLQNAKIAYETKKPLCQDTGQVIVFLKAGQSVCFTDGYINDAINSAVQDCYIENSFRKSVVKNAVFDRTNTNTNTPCFIYTDFIEGDEVKITVVIKGAGSENKSKSEMLLPTLSEKEIIEKCAELILTAQDNACPPMFTGICIGGTLDKACVTSKEALFLKEFDKRELEFSEKVKRIVNTKSPERYSNAYVLDVKTKILPTHIACMPVCVTINCHSDRFSSCTIKNNEIFYEHKTPDFCEITSGQKELKEVFANDIWAIKSLNRGEEVFLTGEIYVARDMAHKRICEMIKNSDTLPFDIKDKIIFYAGPCPAKSGQVIGSIGPTTASRMDKYAIELYNKGLIASIGKGGRNEEVKSVILKNNAKYFGITGGIAALLSEKVKSCEIIAFEDLGAEAVYKLNVEKFPVKVEIG